MKKIIHLPTILIIAIFLLLSTSFLLDDPQVWPDEAIYGDIARNIMLEGRMGTDLWKGFIDGIENHAYSLPPLFLYSSALWYKLFGFSIINQRLFSVFLGAVLLTIFYLLSKGLLASKNKQSSQLLPITATLMLAVDFVFLKASKLSRPEILVLLLVMISVFFYLRHIEERIVKNSQKYLFLTGFFLGLSIITHLIAIGFTLAVICTLIYSQRKNLFDFKKYYLFFLGLILPIASWLIYLYPNYQYLIEQLKLVELSRRYTIPWYINVINFSFLMKLNYFFYLSISLSFVFFSFAKRNLAYILLSLILITAWVFATLGAIYWYTVYAIPFTYLALFVLVNQAFNSKSKKILLPLVKLGLFVICILLLYSNLTNYINLFNIYKNSNNYDLFRTQVAKAVPPGKTVFLSSIPDAYYAFDAGRNQLLEFPALFAGIGRFKKTLEETDYIVLNGIFIPDPKASGYLDQYVTKNLDSVQELTFPYHALIIKLKDKNLRSDVN